MNRRVAVQLCCLVFLLATLPAAAQWLDEPRFYFDEAFTQSQTNPLVFPAIVETYLVLNNPTASGGVGGWEGTLTIDGPGQFAGVELAGQAINGLTPPDFWVGVGDPPLPGVDQVLLATFQILVTVADEPVVLGLEPLYFPSIDDQVSYLNGDGSGEIIPMVINEYEPMGRIGCAPSCGIPYDLFFEEVGVGVVDTHWVTILNYDFECRSLFLDIGFAEPCPTFHLTDVSGEVEFPAKVLQFPVAFTPHAAGYYQCLLSLGDICEDVVISGVCREPRSEPDQLGVFFDEHFTSYQTYAPGGSTVTAHLVMLRPSTVPGAVAWEACVSLTGGAEFGAWNLTGTGTNLLEAPCFRMDMDYRINTYDLAVELATFEIILPPGEEEVRVILGPVPDASLPGQMSWTADGTAAPGLHALTAYPGGPASAWINGEPVAVAALTPTAHLQGGQVTLTWARPAVDFDDCRVYRRTGDGLPELLVAGLLPFDARTFTFRDDLTGLFGDATLYYSYALLKDGREVARSPEAEVTMSGVPAAVTRLLPSVPNPFNPQTEISFETRSPGSVTVTIHDVAGRKILTLVDEQMTAGRHARTWRGLDDGGRRVPSGAYYIRLATDSGVDHGKVVLLK